MADKQKAKGPKPHRQQKSARQAVVDEENTHPVVPSKQPKPRPISKVIEGIIISPIRSDSQDDTGVAIMAVEVLLAVQKGNPPSQACESHGTCLPTGGPRL
jgi:hypothetical protein